MISVLRQDGGISTSLSRRQKERRLGGCHMLFQVGSTVGVKRKACEGLAEGEETRQLGTKDVCGT